MKKHLGDLGLFILLMALLVIPIGSFGLAEIEEENNVLSDVHERPEEIDESEESSESTLPEILDEGYQAPERVVPFFR